LVTFGRNKCQQLLKMANTGFPDAMGIPSKDTSVVWEVPSLYMITMGIPMCLICLQWEFPVRILV
jgi:hypothetical protein